MKKITALLTAILVLCSTVFGTQAAGLAATPSTGDNSMSIIIPIIVLVVAAVGIAVLILLKKKKG